MEYNIKNIEREFNLFKENIKNKLNEDIKIVYEKFNKDINNLVLNKLI